MKTKIALLMLIMVVMMASTDAKIFDRLRARRGGESSRRGDNTPNPPVAPANFADTMKIMNNLGGSDECKMGDGSCPDTQNMVYDVPVVITTEPKAPAPARIETRIESSREDRMELVLREMERRLGIETTPAGDVHELMGHLPTVRVQIISYDGKSIETADIKIERVVLDLLNQQGE